VGRASKRKKANRQTAHRTGQSGQNSGADAATQHAMLQFAAGLKQVLRQVTERTEQGAAAQRAWCGGREPTPAEVPRWPEDSVGDRFVTGSYLAEARKAPFLLTADIPDATVIAANPAHWNVAVSALVRAIVFDGLTLDHPAVGMLLEVLAPIAEAELAYGEGIEAWLYRGGSNRRRTSPSSWSLTGRCSCSARARWWTRPGRR